MSRRQDDFEDDGHVIADMSELSRPSPLGFRRPEGGGRRKQESAATSRGDRPWEQQGMDRQDSRRYIWGALSAALLIAMAYIVGIGLFIALLYWRFA